MLSPEMKSSSVKPAMKSIDERRLESDLLTGLNTWPNSSAWGRQMSRQSTGAAPALGPPVPDLVDAVYVKLHGYDATWRHFVPRQSGYEGNVPTMLSDVTEDHAMIKFRKEHLAQYLTSLVTRPYDGKMVAYLDRVGKIHTPLAGSKQLDVPLVQMNALLGYVADALTATILSLNLDRETEVATLRAFQKLLWLQNDLINRHYLHVAGPAAA